MKTTKLIGLMAHLQDITERKKAENEIKNSEKNFVQLFIKHLWQWQYCGVTSM